MIAILLLLIPALIARFLIVREPWPKKDAGIVCGVYLFILVLINGALSESEILRLDSTAIAFSILGSFGILTAKRKAKAESVSEESK